MSKKSKNTAKEKQTKFKNSASSDCSRNV